MSLACLPLVASLLTCPPPPDPVSVRQIPAACHELRPLIERTVRDRWHPRFTAAIAAQVQQESACKPDAVSRVGASGLLQIMPRTAQDIADRIARDLGGPRPFDVTWNIRAGVSYQRHQTFAVRNAANECEQYSMGLSAYSGGLGFLNRDRKLAASKGADPSRWWNHVEHWSTRAAWAFKENRLYMVYVLKRHLPRYLRAGWPGAHICEGVPS